MNASCSPGSASFQGPPYLMRWSLRYGALRRRKLKTRPNLELQHVAKKHDCDDWCHCFGGDVCGISRPGTICRWLQQASSSSRPRIVVVIVTGPVHLTVLMAGMIPAIQMRPMWIAMHIGHGQTGRSPFKLLRRTGLEILMPHPAIVDCAEALQVPVPPVPEETGAAEVGV